MSDVFISYARPDRAKAEQIASILNDEELSYWWDQLIKGGRSFSEDIEQRLTSSKVVIVLWSKNSSKSRWVKDEAEAAAKESKLIPISIDGTEPPIGFRQFQVIDFEGWNGKQNTPQTNQLLDLIDSKIGRKITESRQVKISFFKRKKPAAAFFALVLIVCLTAFIYFSAGSRTLEEAVSELEANTGTETKKSIAILPFDDLVGNAESEFLATALYEEIFAELASINDIKLISKESVIQSGPSGKTMPEIARELGVENVFRGTIMERDNALRVQFKMLDASSGSPILDSSAKAENGAAGLFRLQDQLVSGIIGALGTKLTDRERQKIAQVPTRNTNAYRIYLQGKKLSRYGDNTEAQIEEAISLFDKAIELDPNFANAYAEKAVALLSLYWSGEQQGKSLEPAKTALNLAAEMAPDNPETLLAMSSFYYFGLRDLNTAADFADRTLRLAPNNADAWSMSGAIARRGGRFKEAAIAFQRCAELNPLRAGNAGELGYTLALGARLDEALQVTSKALKINPESTYLLGAQTNILIHRGEIDRAWETALKIEKIDSGAYDFFRSQMAYIDGTDDQIAQLLSNWPAPRNSEPFLNFFDAMRLIAMHRSNTRKGYDRLLENLYGRVRQELSSDPENVQNQQILALVHALRGESVSVEEITRSLVNDPPPDNQWLVEEGFILVIANAIVGNDGTVFELAELVMKDVSPAQFAKFEYSPFFESFRNDPRYLKLKTRYQQYREM